MSEHTFLLTPVDDMILIATWSAISCTWHQWGAVHADAFWHEGLGSEWYRALSRGEKVIISAQIDLNTTMQLPPDNLS